MTGYTDPGTGKAVPGALLATKLGSNSTCGAYPKDQFVKPSGIQSDHPR